MRNELWNFYLENLQGHPSRCTSGESVTKEILLPKIKCVFIDKEKPLLVLGCGDGKEVFVFEELGFKDVTGLTLGSINIKAAEKDYPGINIVLSDMHDLSEFPSQHYRYIYCNQVFEHAFAPFLFCLEVWSILQHNEIWYVEVPTHISKGSELTDPLTAIVSHHHPNMILPEDAIRMFNATGFHLLKCIPGGNMVYILRKRPLAELMATHYVHPDVINTLRRRLQWQNENQ